MSLLPIETGVDILNTHRSIALVKISDEKKATTLPDPDFSADNVILGANPGKSATETEVVMRVRGEVTTDPTRAIEIFEGLV